MVSGKVPSGADEGAPEHKDWRKSGLFQGLTDAEVAKIVEAAVHKRAPRGGYIFYEGDPAEGAYLITRGLVRLIQTAPHGKTVLLHFFLPGDLIGGIAALGRRVFPASALAVKPTEMLSWNRETLTYLMRSHPRLFQNVLQILEDRFRELQERYRDLATERVEQRLARSLVRLQRQAGERDEDGITIGIPLSRDDLARMTGTTLYSVSRILATWEREGLVKLGRLRVTVADPAKLCALAGLS